MFEKEIEVCQMIRSDMERDVNKMEGQPFTGRNVAVQFGRQAAAISALARIVEELLVAKEAQGAIKT